MKSVRAALLQFIAIVGLTAALSTQAMSDDYRTPEAQDLVYLDLPGGRVIIQLNDVFAPRHAERFRKLVKQGFYDGLSFYRVIDGFVAQGGDESDLSGNSDHKPLAAEFEIEWRAGLPWVEVQEPELFAPETGFAAGFAAARDMRARRAWLTHCPGAVAMARGNDADSARTDFYIVIGQAPRYLDRNLSIFGRVLVGMDVVQRIARGPRENNGIIEDNSKRTRILRARMAEDIPEEQRLRIEVMHANSDAFKNMLDGRRNREGDFWHQPPPEVLDICQVPLPVRVSNGK